MEYRRKTAAATAAAEREACSSSLCPTPSSDPPFPLPRPPAVILSPCGACKFLRRRCVDKCLLAPYFLPSEPLKFSVVHRVFGASNIIKLLQELPEDQRADAANSMVYEANARVRDPIYGCTGMICHLQKQVSELQAELAKAQAEILNMRWQNANLLDHQQQIQMQTATRHVRENSLPLQTEMQYDYENSGSFFADEGNLGFSGGNAFGSYF